MDRAFYLNGRPLLKPPPTEDEILEQRLRASNFSMQDILQVTQPPTVQLIDVEGLRSSYLAKNPLFQSLLQYILSWNEQIIQARITKESLQQPIVKDTLLRALRNQLHEVNNCKNRTQQTQYLDKVNVWYYAQLTKPEREIALQALADKQDELLHFQPTNFPDSMYQSSVKDYKYHYRSQHKDIDPPEDRVKSYQRKNLVSDASTRPGTTPALLAMSTITRPQTSSTAYKMLEALDRPRTNMNQSQSHMRMQPQYIHDTNFPVFETFEEQKTTRRNLFRDQSPLKADKPEEIGEGVEQESNGDSPVDLGNEQPMELIQEQSPKKKKKKGDKSNKYISIAPDHKTFVNDANNIYQMENPGRLGEAQSTYLYHNPTNSQDQQAIARLQHIYIQNRQRELKEKREDDEVVSHVKGWGLNKGRVDEMIVHKGYISAIGSQFSSTGIRMCESVINKPMDEKDETAYTQYLKRSSIPNISRSTILPMSLMQPIQVENDVLPTQVDEEIEDYQEKHAHLEHRINMQKLQKLKLSRGAWLPGGGVRQTPSVEMVNNRKLQSSSSFRGATLFRPFSSVFKVLSNKKEKDSQINEVHLLKNRLASADQFVPINVLQRSIVIPQGHLEPKKIELPVPGMLLASDPEFGKKAGRRGKKKKK